MSEERTRVPLSGGEPVDGTHHSVPNVDQITVEQARENCGTWGVEAIELLLARVKELESAEYERDQRVRQFEQDALKWARLSDIERVARQAAEHKLVDVETRLAVTNEKVGT